MEKMVDKVQFCDELTLPVNTGIWRVSVEEPQHKRGDDQSAEDGQPDLNPEHLHELEERPRPDGFPDDDRDSGLVKVGRHKVDHLLPLGRHCHPGHGDVDLALDEVTNKTVPLSLVAGSE
jgi:hypothetical protein